MREESNKEKSKWWAIEWVAHAAHYTQFEYELVDEIESKHYCVSDCERAHLHQLITTLGQPINERWMARRENNQNPNDVNRFNRFLLFKIHIYFSSFFRRCCKSTRCECTRDMTMTWFVHWSAFLFDFLCPNWFRSQWKQIIEQYYYIISKILSFGKILRWNFDEILRSMWEEFAWPSLLLKWHKKYAHFSLSLSAVVASIFCKPQTMAARSSCHLLLNTFLVHSINPTDDDEYF